MTFKNDFYHQVIGGPLGGTRQNQDKRRDTQTPSWLPGAPDESTVEKSQAHNPPAQCGSIFQNCPGQEAPKPMICDLKVRAVSSKRSLSIHHQLLASLGNISPVVLSSAFMSIAGRTGEPLLRATSKQACFWPGATGRRLGWSMAGLIETGPFLKRIF